MSFFNTTNSCAQQIDKNYKLVVTKINLEGNIIFDDQSLKKSINLRGGVVMNDLMRKLMIAELEGYYSSNGFYLVNANFSKIKTKNKILDIFIDETEEIKKGDAERERAEQAVARLVSYRKLKIAESNRQDAINKLTQKYKNHRINKARIKKNKLEKQKANLMAALGQKNIKTGVFEKKSIIIKSKLSKFKNSLMNSKSGFVPWEQDYKKAQISVDRLINKKELKISPETRQKVIAKLIKAYKEKRLDQLIKSKNLETNHQTSELESRINKEKVIDNSRILKMRQRIKTIMEGQNFANTPN